MIGKAAYTILFYAIAFGTILFALGVVNPRRLLRAAVSLMVVLVLSAGLYVMLGAEFLAGVQVMVYVGGILMVIIFAVMLTHSVELQRDNPTLTRKFLGAIASISFLILNAAVIWTLPVSSAVPTPKNPNNARAIGEAFLDFSSSGFVLPFELVSLLLLVAVIGSIVVSRRHPPLDQPFTSGGDLPGEVDLARPQSQRDKIREEEEV